MREIINIDNTSKVPKYEQLIKSIQSAIKNGVLAQGDLLPSINSIAHENPIARDTVIKAFHRLKSLGIISAVPGKGYFVSQTQFANRHHIFLLFDNFLSYKEALFNSFKATLGDHAVVDLYFHHCNEKIFKTLIQEAWNQYTEYVIMPIANMEHYQWLEKLVTSQRVYILDVGYGLFGKRYPSVCQNFQKQWYHALKSASDKIKKYDKIVLVWWRKPQYEYNLVNDIEMLKGFKQFCQEEQISYEIIEKESEFKVQKNTCYLTPSNEDLVYLIDYTNSNGLRLGKDIGIISHNDEPLKAVAANCGISTITTDFIKMGENMGKMILNNEIKHIENPSTIIIRGSI
ncbi:GntR family transcriptional regulator [candidate division KSB1 bacterium]|nr:GntR family transcriptional regulator [candidate division KSB1 bacterium]